MGEVLGDLAASGYDAVWDIFPAGGPGGVGAPHRRERVFILAHASSKGDVADTEGKRRQRGQTGFSGINSQYGERLSGRDCAGDVPHPGSEGLQGCGTEHELREFEEEEQIGRGSRWAVEPSVGRVAYGVPARVDRLRCIGNAVVPQVARQIGELIINVQDIQGRVADN